MSDPGSELKIDLSDFGVAKPGVAGAGGPRDSGPGRGQRPREEDPGRSRVPGVRSLGRRIRLLLVLALPAAVLPFLLLLRGSVHAYGAWGLGPWPSVVTGLAFAASTLGLITWGGLALLGFPRGFRHVLSRGAIALTLVFVVHGLLHVGVRNVKGDSVRAEYRALHPLLRLGSTILVLVDRNAVVTDAARDREDYRAMGLPAAETSLHYPQDDGYVHALDLRTLGRPEWRNVLVETGYRLMGFRTLRHRGTADHLHVSLPPRGSGRR